jgi:hypothetical protein
MRTVVITEHAGPEVRQAQVRPEPPVGPGEVGGTETRSRPGPLRSAIARCTLVVR